MASPDSAEKRKIILIAEDNAVNMYFLDTIIRIELPDIKVLKALDGQEAVNLFVRFKPDLLILDLSLPLLSGLGVVEYLKKESLFFPENLIVMTANDSEAVRDEMTKHGIVHYLSKPANRDTITLLIKKCLGV